MSRETSRKVSVTKNYRLFERSADNRVLCPKKHKKLERSMKAYGFLSCFPVVCHRNGDKHLIVKDGQHRLAIAETLGLPVYYMEETVDFDVAVVNSTAKVWVTRDYAEKHAANGIRAYSEGLEFADNHKIPVGVAFAILGGTTTYANVQHEFESGAFRIRDRKWADAIAGIYGPITALAPATRNAQLLTACMAVCRVPDFDAKRLLKNAERCRDKLVSYSTREAYLDMLEEIYNHHCSKLLGLKAAATMVMRDRNAALASKKKKEGKAAPSEVAAA